MLGVTSPALARACRKLSGDERAPLLSPTGLELDSGAIVAGLSRRGGAPVRSVTTALFAHAIELGASELRIDSGVVSHVYDGVRVRIMAVPTPWAGPLTERLAFVSGLNPDDAVRMVEVESSITLGDRTIPTRSRA